MNLRSNRCLLIFVTLVFQVEFLAPAFLNGTEASAMSTDGIHQVNTLEQTGFQFLLFTEQLNENENERDTYKSAFPFIRLIFGLSCCYSESSLPLGRLSMNNQSQSFHAQPSIYLQHCVFQV